jgi:hypothetical protein
MYKKKVHGHWHIYVLIKEGGILKSAHIVQGKRKKNEKFFFFFVWIDAHLVPEERRVRKIEPIKNNICVNFNITIHIYIYISIRRFGGIKQWQC